MSLTESIFGRNPLKKDERKEKGDVEVSIEKESFSNLFDSSSSLPKPSLKLNFSETVAQKTKRERKEEKRKKRKSRNETNAMESSAINVHENMNSMGKDEKQKKRKKSEKSDQDGTQNKDSESNQLSKIVDSTSLDEKDERTIFVGNLPKSTTRQNLASIFKKCGTVESSRIRSLATAGIKVAPEYAGNQVSMSPQS